MRDKIGGRILSEDDFRVDEILGRKALIKYERSGKGIKRIEGPYTIIKLTKKGLTTEEAISILAKKYKIARDNIGFAGLKDKFAVTTQYMTIKNFSGAPFHDDNINVEIIGKTDKPLHVGDLEGNRFIITLHDCKNPGILRKKLAKIGKGMPNYFGYQRFGANKNNHIIGKLLVKKNFKKAIELINEQHKFHDINEVPKKRLKFYVNAYQSYLFNSMLKEIKEPVFGDAPIFGTSTILNKKIIFLEILKEVINVEKIKNENFRIDELRMSFRGGLRAAFIVPQMENVEINERDITLKFCLPKGSYATVFLEELGYEK